MKSTYRKKNLVEIIEKIGHTKPIQVIYIVLVSITLLASIDLVRPFFINYFQSELFFRDGPLIRNVSFNRILNPANKHNF